MNHSITKPGFYLSMMKLKDFSFIIFLLFSLNAISQTHISGVLVGESGEKLSYVEVYNKSNGSKTTTNKEGIFDIIVSNSGTYTFVFYKDDFSVLEQEISAPSSGLVITLNKITNLSEVVVKNERDKIFALNKLKDIEETAIYAGKKTEVVKVDKLTANKAANNPRQIYAQVVGLTINESSDGGLQLSIGGRGLDPNRSANFNTRQNGYDISADVLGYPESYYATPTESLDEIQIVRGAASLQYGTQFGGLINFKIKSPSTKPIELVERNTVGSYGLYTNFTSLSGTKGKFSYYTFFNYKRGDGFRPNSGFHSTNYFANLNYQFTEKTSVHFDYTRFDYTAQQAGGLTDQMFEQDPTQSNRTRNWFAVNWNLFALRFKHHFDNDADFSLQLFGLDASRKTVGFRKNRVEMADPGGERDLILGDFVNWGAEARYLKKYNINGNSNAFLIGAKYYQAQNTGIQGPGSSGSDANFNLATEEFPQYAAQSDYKYPNLNISLFGENIFKVSSRFSITPGFRYENIKTQAIGSYRKINFDGAGNVILDETVAEDNVRKRDFFLFGVGLSYKPKSGIEFYGNISQNYRSVTFSDLRTVYSSYAISDDITDEKGFTSDIGIRGQINDKIRFDSSIYALYYNDKIGDYWTKSAAVVPTMMRDNIGTAITYGFETMIDWSLSKTFFEANTDLIWNVFSNVAITDSDYLKSQAFGVKGNKVEFVPLFNIKTGTGVGYKNFMSSIQLTYVTSQFTDATNQDVSTSSISNGIAGKIPTYYVADFSSSYKWKNWKLEAGVTNFTDNKYFTRRATGYPGPGIIPSDTRTFYTTLEFVF